MHFNLRHYARNAVTLIEVVFAMGVVLIGLLGLLSILPLAGRRAQDAMSLSVGSRAAQSVLDELEIRRYLTEGRLRPIPATTPPPPPLPLPDTNLKISPLPAPFCIDPLFASLTSIPGSIVANNGYDPTVFPYYKVMHNPLSDPSTVLAPWPVVQPRLTRVGVTRNSTDPEIRKITLTASQALALVEARDDLIVTRPTDRTLNPNFKDGEVVAVNDGTVSGLEYGQRLPSGDFTWIATVNPLPGGVYASVSVVVMRKRVRTFDPPTATSAPEKPSGNAIDERLAYVTYASGFNGGAGGTVHLVSAANTVSNVLAGDWVMLSRMVGGTPYHRWYRVVSASDEAEEFVTDGTPTMDDTNLTSRFPSAGQSVWRQTVLLDGPDWSFNFLDSSGSSRKYADDTFANNTYATILEDVVSVTERTVLLSNL